ncbi:uncharacterized protein LOC129869897 isoform X7 [Solanum dulcamara]|uniref:uncharacterized protein LOC129869897 isoform X7 n=1 Tax=Solanum dulcamara TaxID=45834 RepID=UPI0024854976|nr:uncharacterized protein LOC129869897 isoform X7 [Solanum dulcamara]
MDLAFALKTRPISAPILDFCSSSTPFLCRCKFVPLLCHTVEYRKNLTLGSTNFDVGFTSLSAISFSGEVFVIAMDTIKQEKVRRFEEFIDRRLKPDLVHAIAERDKVFEQQIFFSDLRSNIENLEKNSVTNLKTLVNIGSEVYVQADVPDSTHIFVDVGLGFHVEFTWSEALNYISAREEKLARQIKEYTRLVASIKVQIKMVCEGIRELLQLPEERAY